MIHTHISLILSKDSLKQANMVIEKLETRVPIEASAEKLFDIFCNKTHTIANIFPEKIQAVEIHEGEWGAERSVISWNYINDGKTCVAKEVVEGIDKENNKMTFKVIEGDLLQHYNSFKFKLQVSPKEKGSVVHWELEYEKKNYSISDPHTTLELVVEEANQVDAYLTNE
ncbi:hypothetical protein VNO78_25901 [Psophocarpus tetragonolobus]|uniref:Bet v I/Major latex protein domain-containing protein n=1 Tax=Psophocarpus tetragonolobus TaxID=3891 RepID=A0AAN9S7Y4_PSOTE